MYVCLCNALTSSDVQRARGQGAATPRDVYRHMNCQPQCGKCMGTIRDLLRSRDHAGRERAEPFPAVAAT